MQFFEFYATQCLHLFWTEDVDTDTLKTLTPALGEGEKETSKKIIVLDIINS